MPIIKSAKKRVRTIKKATIRNAKTKRTLKQALKSFKSKPTATGHNQAQSALSTAVKKRILHKNKAARLQRQLAKKAASEGIKSTASKPKQTKAKAVASKKSTTPSKSIGKSKAVIKKPLKKAPKSQTAQKASPKKA